MSNPAYYDVHAALTSEGRAERMNVLRHRTFREINHHFDDHDEWRWLLVSPVGEDEIHIIDLWLTEVAMTYPYVEARFVPPPFDDLDQAIGYVALHLC